jgi:hypothetical protein
MYALVSYTDKTDNDKIVGVSGVMGKELKYIIKKDNGRVVCGIPQNLLNLDPRTSRNS